MNIILRSLIAASVAAVSSAALVFSASAAINSEHAVSSDSALNGMGFLGYKSFLIGRSGRDDPGIALESMRIISPATIFSAKREYRQTLLPPELYMPLKPLKPLPAPATRDVDSLQIDVKGVPMTFSLGLKQALHKDLKAHMDLFGVSGLTNPAIGFASAAYLQSATHDVMEKIGRLEQMNREPAALHAETPSSRKIIALREPPTILMFLTGLLFIVLLRGDRLQARASS